MMRRKAKRVYLKQKKLHQKNLAQKNNPKFL